MWGGRGGTDSHPCTAPLIKARAAVRPPPTPPLPHHRAFLKAPRILLFDEATSALDSHTEGGVMEALHELAKVRDMPPHRPLLTTPIRAVPP